MLVTNIDNIKKAIKEVKRKPKKWIEGNFIRGPIDLMELQRFMQRGTRLTKLYLQIIYKQGLQENGPIETCPSCGRGIAPKCDGCSE